MDNNILSALKAVNVSELTRADWIAVGMALKEEGYPCSIWDDWSKNDSRYHPGECQKKWDSFHGSGNPVKGGTIVQMAKERGWVPYSGEDGAMNWDDAIEYDGVDGFNGFPQEAWDPVQDLITYLELLFEKDDLVGYVTNDVWQDADGKWLPSKGVYDRTAGELIASLKKHPDDLGATVGDWKPECGAWIRFNPLDGDGVKNENVTKFRYALVESDTLPVAEQDILFRKLELPITALVHSGGKSLHAIVHIDAEDYSEYRKRVEYLYDFLEKNGVSIDKQNRNPSRLSRMPGVTRNGNRQYLVATNIGRKSWVDWMDFAEGVSDELPAMVSLDVYKDDPPKLPEEMIKGKLLLLELRKHVPEYPLTGPLSLHAVWLYPAGRTHKPGTWRVTRPDTDNIEKLLKDCMTKCGFWKDDAQVVKETAEKRWSDDPTGIEIEIIQLNAENTEKYAPDPEVTP